MNKFLDQEVIAMRILLFIILLLSSVEIGLAETPNWFAKIKQIAPFKTTEKDIEELFGKSVKGYSIIKEYKTREGKLSVYYSSGRCSEKKSTVVDNYDVDKGVVTSAHFRVDKEVKFKSLRINLVGFLKEEADDAPGAIGYTNRDLGIGYSLVSDLLFDISLFQPDDLAYLDCQNQEK